jgi:Eukaryotic cytochrome b561
MFTARYGKAIPCWFYAHGFFQILALAAILGGFALAVRLPSVEDNHFRNLHGRIGLGLVIALMVQVVLAASRPDPVGRVHTSSAAAAEAAAVPSSTPTELAGEKPLALLLCVLLSYYCSACWHTDTHTAVCECASCVL